MSINKIFITLIIISISSLFNYISCDINIHVIPHTHLDPGWLKTPEEYYNQEAVGLIFKTVLESLSNNKERTFIINEIYYFKIWYEKLQNQDKSRVKQLITEKRLEFVFCGYVVNDEATPIYYDIIDNIRLGLQFLFDEFNIKPKSAFFLDSFGHNSGNAHIVSQMGFDSLVLGRMHHDYLDLLKEKKLLEFNWDMFGKGNSNKNILTHVLALHYGYTQFLQDLEDNVGIVLPKFISFLSEILKGIKHKNILFLFGDDFKYTNDFLFNNIDNLKNQFETKQREVKNYFNTNEKINFFYSTPEKYFSYMEKELKELSESQGQNLETITHKDFYPLRTDCYWTGYFTSRPYLKGFIRKASNAFYSFSKYFSFNRFNDKRNFNYIYNDLNELRAVVALNQHHDAITGTCKQYVATDYINRMEKKLLNVEKDFKNNLEEKFNIKIDLLSYNNYISDIYNNNDFILERNNDNKIKIGIYNPIMTNDLKDINKILIQIEISNSKYYYEIEGIKSNFFCINEKSVNNPELFVYKNKCFLNFFLQFKKGEEITFITLIKTGKEIYPNKYNKLSDINLKTKKIELIKDDINIKSLEFNPKKFSFDLKYLNEDEEISEIYFSYFDGMYYVNAGTCRDGAYIFSPYNRYPDKISIQKENSFYIKGDIGITFVTRNDMTSFTFFTFYYDPFFVKVEHFFDNIEKNYFLKRFSFAYNFVIQTDIDNLNSYNKSIFYTDANGLEPMKRIVDTFDYEETESPSTGGNFYPVTSYISIKDKNNKKNKITLFTDRPQGGSGFLPGSVSLSLQRMSYGTDNKGLTESIYENESMKNDNFRTTHLIVFGNRINKYLNEKNKYMEYKTNLLNLVYNYMNKAVVLFRIKGEGDNYLNNKIKEENDLINNNINKYLFFSEDIRANYEIINDNLIIGQYFRYNNYIFNSNNLKNDNNDNFGIININFPSDTKFKIYCDKTGINYKIRHEKMFSDEMLKEFKEPKNQSFSLKYNEFIFIYFYFEN